MIIIPSLGKAPALTVQGATLLGEATTVCNAYGATIVDHANNFQHRNDDTAAAVDSEPNAHAHFIPGHVPGIAARQTAHTKTPVEKLPVYSADGTPLRMRQTTRIVYGTEEHLKYIDEHCPCDLQEAEYVKHREALAKQYADPDDYRFGHVHTFQITCPVCGWGARVEQNHTQYAIPLHGFRDFSMSNMSGHCDGVYAIVTSQMVPLYDLQRYSIEAPYVPPVPVYWQAYNEWTGKYLLEDGTEDPDRDKAFKFTDRARLGTIIAEKTAQLAAKDALASKEWLHVWAYTEKGAMLPDLDPNSPTYAEDQLLIELLGYHPGDSSLLRRGVLTNTRQHRRFAVVVAGVVFGVYNEQTGWNGLLPTGAQIIRIQRLSQIQPGWQFTGTKFRLR